MSYSAPVEQPHIGSGPQCRTAGAEARQSPRHIAQRRLARSYWLAVTIGSAGIFTLIAMGGTAFYLDLPYIAAFYAVLAGHMIFALSVLGTFRKHYDAANKCCCAQAAAIRTLERQNIDLLMEKSRRISGAVERGLAGDAAVDFDQPSERAKSAAVVQLHKTDGGL